MHARVLQISNMVHVFKSAPAPTKLSSTNYKMIFGLADNIERLVFGTWSKPDCALCPGPGTNKSFANLNLNKLNFANLKSA